MRTMWWGYVGLNLAALMLYPFVSRSVQDALILLTSVAAVLGVWVGVRVHRPDARAPWLLLLAGVSLYLVGDVVSVALQPATGGSPPFPSIGDAAHLLFYPVMFLAMWCFLRARAIPDRTAWLDASIWTIGAALVMWEPLIQPYVMAPGAEGAAYAVALAYPLLDLGLLLIVLRMLAGRSPRPPAYLLLTGGLLVQIVVDFVYGVRMVEGLYSRGEVTDTGWMLVNLLVGAAALHPSMVRLTEPVTDAAGSTSRRRLRALAAPALLAPALLIYQLLSGQLTGEVLDGYFTAAIMILLVLLVAARGNGLLTVAEQRSRELTHRKRALELVLEDRERSSRELRRQVDRDTLTGLASRDRFIDMLALDLAAWNAGGPRPSIAFLDLDDFKTVNDTLGHDVGDLLLVEVANRLRDALGPDHLIARLGGDEFAVLMHGDAELAAERLLDVLRPPMLLSGLELRSEVSIGVTTGDPHSSPGDMLREADVAMYTAKRSGGGWARYRTGMSTVLLERLDLRTRLAHALQDGEIEPWFQPIVDLDTGRVLGFEALARWCRPGAQVQEAGEWFALAEETGLVNEVDHTVLSAAVTQLAAWRRDPSCSELTLAVNLSGRTLQQPGIEEEVLAALRVSGVPPERLIVEVTEGILINDQLVGDRLRRLRGAGVRIALDDFGTGWSSLSYLGRFPVDQLKLDRTFTAELGAAPGAEAIPAAIIQLARGLSLGAVAEGVETADQRRRLSVLGFRAGQGYLFGLPRPAGECELPGSTRRMPPVPVPGPAGKTAGNPW